jgi:hypothetical protein
MEDNNDKTLEDMLNMTIEECLKEMKDNHASSMSIILDFDVLKMEIKISVGVVSQND